MAIRDAYPEIGNLIYVPFQEVKDEMNAYFYYLFVCFNICLIKYFRVILYFRFSL